MLRLEAEVYSSGYNGNSSIGLQSKEEKNEKVEHYVIHLFQINQIAFLRVIKLDFTNLLRGEDENLANLQFAKLAE